MKRFVVREVETLKTTAAFYGPCELGCCEVSPGFWVCCEQLIGGGIGVG